MKNFPLRLEKHVEMEAWAKGRGMSLNAAINLACELLVGEVAALREENRMLREKVVEVAMGKANANMEYNVRVYNPVD